jgi:hypothetical protein
MATTSHILDCTFLARDKQTDATEIIQDLYDSEINARREWLCDGGFSVSLGDMLNGRKATDNFRTFAEAVDWLRTEVVKRCPESAFARKYRQ